MDAKTWRSRVDDQAIHAESFFVEVDRGLHPSVQIEVRLPLIARLAEVDADLLEQLSAFGRIRCRPLDVRRAAFGDQHSSSDGKLVPTGVAAEVVVVVENENLRVRCRFLAKEVGSRKATHSAADDDELVEFTGISPGVDSLSVAN